MTTEQIQKLQAKHNFSDLTIVAVKTVYEATGMSRNGYTQAVRDKLEKQDAWTKGWFSEGIAQGLYLHDLKQANDFAHVLKFVNDGLDRISVIGAYVGIGLAVSQTGVFSEDLYNKLDLQLRSWVFDGAGFYKLMVADKPDYEHVPLPAIVEGDVERPDAYGAGIGRALWFNLGEKNLAQVVDAIESFPEQLRGSIWRGVGFASTYAGGTRAPLTALKGLAREYVDCLQIGCVCAALEQGTESVPHREVAADVYTGKSIAETIQAVASMPGSKNADGSLVMSPASDSWREMVLAAVS